MKEITISLTITIPLERTDINWVEEVVVRKREEVFKEVFREVVKVLEEGVKRPECECGAGAMVKEGKNARKVVTLVGEVEFERQRYGCSRCGAQRYPLDELLGMEPQKKCTVGVEERALWTAVEVSYEKSEEFLKKFTGLEVSRGLIHTMALEEGRRIMKWEEERREEVFGKGEDIDEGGKAQEVFYVQVDGTGVNDRENKEWMECKVGASFSRRAVVSKNRVKLVDKRSYAAIEGVEAFGEKFFLECVKNGVLEAKTVFFIGDGARWIRGIQRDYFPGSVGVLDLWHLERELKLALGEEREKEVEACKALALAGRGSEIIQRLMQVSSQMKSLEEMKKIVQVMGYVRGNLDWIANIPKVGEYGSGPVEKTVDVTVCRRFKKRGMSWYRWGANPLLKLRLLKLNGEWEAYWQSRRDATARYAA